MTIRKFKTQREKEMKENNVNNNSDDNGMNLNSTYKFNKINSLNEV